MAAIHLNLKNRSYSIVVGTGILKDLGRLCARLRLGENAYVITNVYIQNAHACALAASLQKAKIPAKFCLIPDTEKSKSIERAARVLKDLARFESRRRVFIIAFGGGVVGDLSGFVASVYKRGVAYIQVPTTLLAQVDSAIGGKTAIDLPEGKNLIGAFYQPRLVLSDVLVLKTLSDRQIRSGLAEVIKYGAIKDATLFSFIEKHYRALLSKDVEALEYVVARCSKIKAEIVSADEKEERGIRTLLNFGHTLGHAIEAAAHYTTYTHGEAVALGMLVATSISRRLGQLSVKDQERVFRLVKNIGLPVRIRGVSAKAIINAHYRDKKFIGSLNRFVLLEGIAKAGVVKNVPLTVITQAMQEWF